MDPRINSDYEEIDHRTCRSICNAVGERLQERMRPETPLSPLLLRLVDQLRRQESEVGPKSSRTDYSA
jgi:hypothetical protein